MNHYTTEQLSGLYTAEIATRGKSVIKVGTNVLTDQVTRQLNPARIENIVDQAASLYLGGWEIAIVTSGAIGAGEASVKGLGNDRDLPTRQALASIGQPDLMGLYKQYFRKHGIEAGQLLASYGDLTDPIQTANFLKTVKALYELKAVPILNENDPFSTEELEAENGDRRTFGDNDLLSVMATETLGADVLFMLSTEDGLRDYSAGETVHVVDNPEYAQRYISDEVSPGGKGGMSSKLESIIRATDSGIFVVLLSGLDDNVILRVMQGEPLGTLFLPKNFK